MNRPSAKRFPWTGDVANDDGYLLPWPAVLEAPEVLTTQRRRIARKGKRAPKKENRHE
jgi:hypothetical protein